MRLQVTSLMCRVRNLCLFVHWICFREQQVSSETQVPSPASAGPGEVPRTPLDLFGNVDLSLDDASEFSHVTEPCDTCEPRESASDESVEIVEPEADIVSEQQEEVQVSDVVAPQQTWNEMVASSFAQFRAVPTELLFPWETGPMAAVFNFDADPLPQCPGLAEMPPVEEESPAVSLQHQLSRFLMPEDAKYMHAVKSIQDMSYFEGKAEQLDLACGQWLRILSVSWSSSGVGPQLATALQKDSTGVEACVILKACFGVKSPSTLLKRAGAFKKFFTWYEKSMVCREMNQFPLPLDESVVWEYFLHLKKQRERDARGYTIPSSFLEAVRFAKFTLDLSGTDAILGSGRLLGFSALEKKAKGPTIQAPGLEPEHIRRLHEEWMSIYQQVGLDLHKQPLGPLLPAPRIDGSFCAKPLSTAEAATWLRGLLHGTSNSDTFRSHSLKASLLVWCARAGLDKESRAVLGHHCSALSGSEVVYSRHLQTRTLRKLCHILRRVRAGLAIEDGAVRACGLVSTFHTSYGS
eukprot:s4_g49.t1